MYVYYKSYLFIFQSNETISNAWFLQCLNLTEEQLEAREVDFVDIAYDELNPKHYKEAEDPKFFKSIKTGRGPLIEGWRDDQDPIMCSYKLVDARFEVWGLQTKVEDFIQRVSQIEIF